MMVTKRTAGTAALEPNFPFMRAFSMFGDMTGWRAKKSPVKSGGGIGHAGVGVMAL